MEIEVGEYVRTKDGYIGKLIEYIPNALNYLKIDVGREIKHNDALIDNYIYTRYGFQLKHSKNIIDLIEKGDYVNGEKVVSILNGFVEGTMEIELANHKKIYRKNVNEIKTIVTKEQFEQNCYRLEENNG